MGAQRASAQGPSADTPDGFGVAVVCEEGQWHCSAMARKSLTSLTAAETELREKFRELAGIVLTEQGVASVERAVDRCDKWHDIGELTVLCRRHGRPS